MKTILSIFIAFISFTAISQTITPKPIYKDITITISEMDNGGIWFGYQNPDYTTIIDIVSFTASSKSSAIALIEKAIFILGMEKTDKEQHIYDNFDGVKLVRYGFSQKEVGLSDGKARATFFNLKQLNKIKLALENFNYVDPKNK
jgi:hypothetical protein